MIRETESAPFRSRLLTLGVVSSASASFRISIDGAGWAVYAHLQSLPRRHVLRAIKPSRPLTIFFPVAVAKTSRTSVEARPHLDGNVARAIQRASSAGLHDEANQTLLPQGRKDYRQWLELFA